MPVRILVADRLPVVREGLKAVLAAEPDLLVCGEADDGEAAVARAAAAGADVVVAEAWQPGLDGAELAARLGPARRVVLLTECEEPPTVRRALAAGAAGYVLKRSPAACLVQAVRATAAGGTYLDPNVAGRVVAPSGGGRPGLSEREVQVLKLLARGNSNKEIAAKLSLSVKTIETYKARSLEKLGVSSRVGIVRHAIASGWLTDGADGAANGHVPPGRAAVEVGRDGTH